MKSDAAARRWLSRITLPACAAAVIFAAAGQGRPDPPSPPSTPATPPAALPANPAPAGDILVPFRLTDTNHLLIRAKLNGRGPYHFILDTGAPGLFVSTEAAKAVGLTADKKGRAVVDVLEVEGGATLHGIKAYVNDPFQIAGMNAMGLPGAKLDGVIGYGAAARFRIRIDLTRRHLVWTPLAFDPPEPPGAEELFGGEPPKDATGPIIEILARAMGLLLRASRAAPPIPQGVIGLEVGDAGGEGAAVTAVQGGSPAEAAGVKAGDVVTQFRGRKVATADELIRRAGRVAAGDEVRFQVRRGGEDREITLRAAAGY